MFRALAWGLLALGASAAPFALFAAAEGEEAVMRGFFVTAAAGIFVGGATLAGTASLNRPAGAAAALRLAFYGWLVAPLFASPPFIMATGGSVTGLFEAYSALTTTGAVVLAAEDAPASIILWRCWLAWLGGLVSLVLAATVFAALDRRGVGLRRTSLLTVERADLFTNFGRAIRRLGLVYALATAVGWLALMLSGTPAFAAVCLALSGVATAGFTPFSVPLLEAIPAPAVLVLAALCLAGAWNFAVQYELLSRFRAHRGTGELRAMGAVAGACGIAALFTAGPEQLGPAVLDALFAVTTAGFDASAAAPVPIAALVLLAMVGGSPISTSGGIKMPRVLLLARRAAGELSLLSHPSAAVRTRFAGRSVSDDALAGVWVYAIAFPVALGFGAVAIGLGGAEFSDAWRAAAASLANAGPLGGVDYALLSGPSLAACALLMVAGRLEVLAAAAAVYVIFARD